MAPPPTWTEPSNGAGLQSILIVDDSGFARRTIRIFLEEAGYSVEEAADGFQALERYYIKEPELVLLDNVMPGMTGLEVLKKMRAMNPLARVVMLTSDVQNFTQREARINGAVGYLNKPLKKEKILYFVAKVLKSDAAWVELPPDGK